MSTPSELSLSTYAHTGDHKLAVDRYRVQADAKAPHVMFCGGFHSAMQGEKASKLLSHCQAEGWHYTRFDYRGHGQSDGAPADFTISNGLDDALAVLDEQDLPTVLVGSSMGAWLATLCALRRPRNISGLVLIAAAPDFLHELVLPTLDAGQIWDLQQGAAIELDNDYENPHPVTQALLDSGETLSLLKSDALSSLACPIRLLHGTRDNVVPFELAVRLMNKLPANHDAALTLLHEADHRLSDASSITHILDTLTSMVEKTRLKN